MSHADTGDIGERVTDRGQRRYDGCFPNTTNSVRMIGVWDLKDLGVDERQVRADRYPVIQKTRILQAAILIVDIFLIQCLAYALGSAALELSFDIVGMDRLAGVLNNGITHNFCGTGFRIQFDIADVARK